VEGGGALKGRGEGEKNSPLLPNLFVHIAYLIDWEVEKVGGEGKKYSKGGKKRGERNYRTKKTIFFNLLKFR